MVKTVKKRSVVPVYGIAAVWVIFTAVHGLWSVGDHILAAVLSAAAFFLLRLVFPTRSVEVTVPDPPVVKTQEEQELDALRAEGDRAVSEMRRLNDSIRDEKISRQIDHLEQTTGKIFRVLEEKPEKRGQVRRFLDYFLPTTLKLLNAYDRAASTGISGENIDATKQRVNEMLDQIEGAFDRQLDALFGDEALDISTDIQVMDTMLKQEGLSEGGMPG